MIYLIISLSLRGPGTSSNISKYLNYQNFNATYLSQNVIEPSPNNPLTLISISFID